MKVREVVDLLSVFPPYAEVFATTPHGSYTFTVDWIESRCREGLPANTPFLRLKEESVEAK